MPFKLASDQFLLPGYLNTKLAITWHVMEIDPGFLYQIVIVAWKQYYAAVGGKVQVGVRDSCTRYVDGHAPVQNGSRTDIRPAALLLPRNHCGNSADHSHSIAWFRLWEQCRGKHCLLYLLYQHQLAACSIITPCVSVFPLNCIHVYFFSLD